MCHAEAWLTGTTLSIGVSTFLVCLVMPDQSYSVFVFL